jgi:hypothetical protein
MPSSHMFKLSPKSYKRHLRTRTNFCSANSLTLLQDLYEKYQRKLGDILGVLPAEYITSLMIEVEAFDRLYHARDCAIVG